MVKFGCGLPGASFVPQAGDAGAIINDPFNQLMDNLALLSKHDYDFAELTVGTLVGAPEDDFPNWVQMIKASGIDIPVLNSFIPPTIKLTGPNVNKDTIEDYLKIA